MNLYTSAANVCRTAITRARGNNMEDPDYCINLGIKIENALSQAATQQLKTADYYKEIRDIQINLLSKAAGEFTRDAFFINVKAAENFYEAAKIHEFIYNQPVPGQESPLLDIILIAGKTADCFAELGEKMMSNKKLTEKEKQYSIAEHLFL